MDETVDREERRKALLRELSKLKAELRKTKGAYKRAVIISEIRNICGQIERLME
ncbi:MAG: hypothetical protein II875_12620 [Clostridia bacterium]|nr:hypothetical protein [Clostridia bacterium]